MDNTEKISVKWDDFDRNIKSSFTLLRNAIEFSDVTLACEDGKQFLVHKAVLASQSPFFLNLLKRNQHPHPLIYMRGVNAENLVSIVDLLYHGETKIQRENLPGCLSLAEEIQLDGFTTGQFPKSLQEENFWDFGNNGEPPGRQTVIKKGFSSPNNDTWGERLDSKESVTLTEPSTDIKQTSNLNIEPQELAKNDAQSKTERDGYNFHFEQMTTDPESYKLQMEQLDEKIATMMEFSENFLPTKPGQRNRKERKRICKLCGKEDKMGDIKRHIEAKHFTGLLHVCSICGNLLGTRYKLARHKSKQHGK